MKKYVKAEYNDYDDVYNKELYEKNYGVQLNQLNKSQLDKLCYTDDIEGEILESLNFKLVTMQHFSIYCALDGNDLIVTLDVDDRDGSDLFAMFHDLERYVNGAKYTTDLLAALDHNSSYDWIESHPEANVSIQEIPYIGDL